MDAVKIFPWNRNLETGISQIDEQHEKLVQLLNMLASHIAYQTDAPTLNKVFDELVAYSIYHFASEEAIWYECFVDDDSVKNHRVQHQSFVDTVQELRAGMNSSSVDQVLADVLSFLTRWLASHILEEDRRMARAALSIRQGVSIQEAKAEAERWMTGAVKVMLDTLLSMYTKLSNSTLSLMKEMHIRRRMEEKLRQAASVFENTFESICIVDTQYRIVEANPEFCRKCQHSREELIGHPLAEAKSGLLQGEIAAEIWEKARETGHWSGEVVGHLSSGELYSELMTVSAVTNEQGEMVSYVVHFANVAEYLLRQRTLRELAQQDALTGLPNRLVLLERLKLTLAVAERMKNTFAVFYLDLDGFKPINDTYGHAVGDEALVTVARRLSSQLRSIDTISRVGGDEFVIIAGGLPPSDECRELLERLLSTIREPIEVSAGTVNMSASIGVSFYPLDGTTSDQLLQLADKAMYSAKTGGKSRYIFYHEMGAIENAARR